MMKKTILVAFITALTLSNCSDGVISEATIPLTQAEINDLKFLREEEKLARDVYLFSYDKYQISVFNSIAQSEQTHMNSVLTLLKKYNISDPASTQRGVFQNEEIQNLYNSLTTQSSISSIEALKVGATIEDLDINDIDHFINNTTKSDLLGVYDNLTCGSKNHIRSYTNQLFLNGVTYVSQYISSEYYAVILGESSGGCNK